MFIRNNAYNAPIAHSVDGENSGAAKLANDVQAIEREFSLMEQEHARIRAEALAAQVHNVCGPESASADERGTLDPRSL